MKNKHAEQLAEILNMNQNMKETIGYIVNGLSIALFIYLVSILEVPDFLRPLRYFGWILLSLGIGLVVLSIVSLVRNQSTGLIERGIYGVVRHPMYVGAMLCYLSYVFFHPHWLILLISSVNIAIIYWFVLRGEQQNVIKFGDAYRRYMENVPRINLLAGILRLVQNK
jgi:protein-S-isoprenylcysteine O-methyltransferase Ste14